MISFRPLTTRIVSKLRRVLPFDDVAVETVEWAPGTVRPSLAVIQLSDELDRIVAFNKTVTREAFLSRCVEREEHHPPTIARRYDGAIVGDGSIYAGRGVHTIHRRGRALAWREKPVELGPRLLATNFTAEQYFGHWLLDGVCLELLAEDRGLPALGLHRDQWTQEPGYRVPLDLALERHSLARVERLWVVDDRAMNAGHVARMQELRRRVRDGATTAGPSGSGAPVFLRRVGGVKRPLLNQDALADALARRGFVVLTPETETVDALRGMLHDAPMVVSVEGSALCHAVAGMADGGTIVAIQPPKRVDWIQKVWADAAGLRLAQTVATEAHGDGFTMEEDRLLRLFDLVARERARDAA